MIFDVQLIVLSTMVLGEQMEFQQRFLNVSMMKTTIKDFNTEKSKKFNLQKINGTSPNANIDVKVCIT